MQKHKFFGHFLSQNFFIFRLMELRVGCFFLWRGMNKNCNSGIGFYIKKKLCLSHRLNNMFCDGERRVLCFSFYLNLVFFRVFLFVFLICLILFIFYHGTRLCDLLIADITHCIDPRTLLPYPPTALLCTSLALTLQPHCVGGIGTILFIFFSALHIIGIGAICTIVLAAIFLPKQSFGATILCVFVDITGTLCNNCFCRTDWYLYHHHLLW